ncbi:polysaccharide pyruvyl transferase family protein [Truepera radiovictrix]|uniref:polysaccharide pyruvyl transferase family protein n=1 Tax=Truepera radiovictrix TaxID=332249 RepID=UPI0002FC39E8|nr:polysaccharide pyruvyl transferase family protein [Truepera radiovictrix]WMT56376.1 polysaccharide pyruvyl transferase family protein [Truepera radiovictrix]
MGDEAILSGLSAGLKARGFEVTALSGAPRATEALHGVRAAHRVRALLPALLQHDALISGGGGLLQDRTSARSLRYYLGVLALARRLGKRAVVYGQSVGPLSPAGQRAVASTLRGLPVAVRDEASRELLYTLGVPAALTADAALLLPRPRVTPGGDAPVLLIPRGGFPEATATLVALGKRLAAAGLRVAAMSVQAAEDDAPVRALAAHVSGLEPLRADTVTAALAHVARSRAVVSVRLHGLVFAALAERPFYALAYDPKVTAFMQEVGTRAYPLRADTAQLFDDVLRGARPPACAPLRRRAAAGLDWLEAQLKRP